MQSSIVPMVAALSARRRKSGGGGLGPENNNDEGCEVTGLLKIILCILVVILVVVLGVGFFGSKTNQETDKKEIVIQKITYPDQSREWSTYVTATTRDGKKIVGFLPNKSDVLSIQSIVIFNSDFTKFEFVPKEGTVIEVNQTPPN